MFQKGISYVIQQLHNTYIKLARNEVSRIQTGSPITRAARCWETKGAQSFTCIYSGNNCRRSNVLKLRNELVDTIPTQCLYALIVLHCSPASIDKNSFLWTNKSLIESIHLLKSFNPKITQEEYYWSKIIVFEFDFWQRSNDNSCHVNVTRPPCPVFLLIPRLETRKGPSTAPEIRIEAVDKL